MNEIRTRNFRCFRDEQTARLAPLTLLVGENSTGKTSFLALIRALWDAAFGRDVPDFKEPPYDLGSFDEIAHHRGGRSGRAAEFEAGFRATTRRLRRLRGLREKGRRCYDFDVTFSRRGTAPVPTGIRLGSNDVTISDQVMIDGSRSMRLRTGRGEWSWDVGAAIAAPSYADGRMMRSLVLRSRMDHAPEWVPVDDSPEPTADDRDQVERLAREFDAPFRIHGPFASAPVRSKPRRTYDPSRPARDPEGETIPMLLSEVFLEHGRPWRMLKEALERFGREAGLFDEISVRSLGKRGSEPFQMQVRKYGRRTKGPMRNVIDVGYGVSQVLPVITELFRADRTPMYLLQQPEVHLHPSAQAALGSLFCDLAAEDRQLVVETHSDHLLDRVRMDVRDGTKELKPRDVSILYFERGDLDVQIHSLRLDGEGNVLGAPPSYRRFFLDETQRSLRL